MMDTIKAPGALNTLNEQLPCSYAVEAEPGTYAGRYIRMTAVNSGPCPPWHEAAGAESWMFVDELEVR